MNSKLNIFNLLLSKQKEFSKKMQNYYDNTTDDFFKELNHGQQIKPIKRNYDHISTRSNNYPIYYNQDPRLAQSTPRMNLAKSQTRSRSQSRSNFSSPTLANSNNNYTNEAEQPKIRQNINDNIDSKYSMTNFHKWNSNDTFNIRHSSQKYFDDSKDNNYTKSVQTNRYSPSSQKIKYINAKTQTSTKKNLEISNSISVDYYYSKIISFDVDPQSLHISFHKRTKHRKKRENLEQPLNFISKYIPNCEANEDKVEKSKKSESILSLSDNFDEDAKNCWQSTLQRFKSMKSTKAVFNSIRLSEFKHYCLTNLEVPATDNQQNYAVEESQLLKFQILYQELNQDTKRKNDSDIIHLYSWHRLSIDPKKIVLSLTRIYQSNFCENHSVKNDDLNEFIIFENLNDCINRIYHYVIAWISLFPTDFVSTQDNSNDQNESKNSDSSSFVEDLINLITLIMSSSPNFMKSSMIILAVIYFIYNGEINPLMFSHFPCLKPKITDKRSPDIIRLIDLQVEPQILARHFTYAELHFLRNITRNDVIIEERWEKSEQLQALFKRFNETCSFIVSSIIKYKDDQLKRIDYWITVMSEAMKIRNYQLMFEIEAALSSPLLNEAKLGLTISQNLKFDKMKSFIYSKHYKEDLLQRKEVCLPFFGMIFKKILKLFRSQNASSEKSIENVHVMNDCVNTIEFLFSEWGTQYTFDLDSSLLKAIRELDGKFVSNDELKEI